MPDQFQYIKMPDGSYGKFRADATDAQIRSAVLKDFPTAYGPAKPEVSISAAPPSGLMHPINWLNEAESDLKYGGGKTWLGRGFKAVGGQPLYSGTSEQVADTIAGPILGTSRMMRGLLSGAETPLTKTEYEKAHPVKTGVRALNNVVGGAGQAAALPLAATNPEFLARAAVPVTAGAVGSYVTKELGGDQDTQELVGNLTGLAAGAVQEGAPTLGRAARESAPNMTAKATALGKTAAQDAVSRVPVLGRMVRRPSIPDYIEAARAKAKPASVPEPEFVSDDDVMERVTGGGLQLPRVEDLPQPDYNQPWGGNTSATGSVPKTRSGLSDYPNVISNEEANAKFQGRQPEPYQPPTSKPAKPAPATAAFPELVGPGGAEMTNPEPVYRGLGPEPKSTLGRDFPKFARNAPASKSPAVPYDMYAKPGGRPSAGSVLGRSSGPQGGGPEPSAVNFREQAFDDVMDAYEDRQQAQPQNIQDALEESIRQAETAKALKATTAELSKPLQAPSQAVPTPAGSIPDIPEGYVRVYQGREAVGGGGSDQRFFSKDVGRAESYAGEGGTVHYVDLPQDVFEAGRRAAKKSGSGTGGDVVLEDRWIRKAQPHHDVKGGGYEIDFTPSDEIEQLLEDKKKK